jgi:hypothetical protein
MNTTLQDTEIKSDMEKRLSTDNSTTSETPSPEPKQESKPGEENTSIIVSAPAGNAVSEGEPVIEYVTGFRLILATGIVSLATFTMLLDTAIIVTVRV